MAARAVSAEGAMLRPREDLAGLNAELQQIFNRSDWARAEAEDARASLGNTHRAVKLLLDSGALARATSLNAPARCLDKLSISFSWGSASHIAPACADACVRCPHLFLLPPGGPDDCAEEGNQRPQRRRSARSPGAGAPPCDPTRLGLAVVHTVKRPGPLGVFV